MDHDQKIPIRLEEIHYLFSPQLNGDSKALRFNNIDFYVRNKIVARNDFAIKILPREFYLVLEGSTSANTVLGYDEKQLQSAMQHAIAKERRTTLSRVFKNEGNHGSKDRYQEVVNLLVHKSRHEYDTWDTSTYRRTITSNWVSLIDGLTEAETADLKNRISLILKQLPEGNPHAKLISERLNQDLPEAMILTSLTLIACTLHLWSENETTDYDWLARDIILPPGENQVFRSRESQKILQTNAKHARKIFSTISESMEYVTTSVVDAQKCYETCMKVLEILPLDDGELLGNVYFTLFNCCRNKSFSLPDGTKADHYLKQAQKYAHPEALKIALADYPVKLYDSPERGISDVSGKCYVNTELGEEIIASVLTASLPANWTIEYFDGSFSPDAEVPVHYLLCKDSIAGNYQDLLRILDYYKRNWNEHNPYDVEIFMIGDEEQLGNLVDTAQQYMEERVIPIHIINEHRIAAQHLLARHPLFYPLLDYPINPAEQKPSNLHFIVMGNDICAEYLVREASWMMTFDTDKINPKITILSDSASILKEHIAGKCPGLQDGIADIYPQIEGMTCCIEAKNVTDYYSFDFTHELEKLLRSDDALYFAISGISDEENLQTAIMLRERMIQYYVANGNVRQIKKLPPIAFRCKDFNIANMARNMVVSKINHGNSWFNNHEIIPFGIHSELFSWGGLVDNPILSMAKCVHLMYNGFEIPHTTDFLTKDDRNEIKRLLMEYYRRQYNKNSSMAVALSMPYRLFSCVIRSHRGIPKDWDITDPNAYFSHTALEHFGKELRNLSFDAVQQMAQWEHERWSRWMISDGWLPATADDVLLYQCAGVPQHQLYIGKLHPCICDWKELLIIEKELGIDFHSYDIDSAQKTSSILEMLSLVK